MKKVLFVINTLGGAGAEKALLELLKRFPENEYEVLLYVLLAQGELIHQVPEQVKILNPSYSDASFLSKKGKHMLNRQIFKRLFMRGAIFKNLGYMLKNMAEMLKKGKLYPDKLLWRVMADSAQVIDGHYDMAVAFLEGGSTYYIHDHIRADRKVTFLHVDYSYAGYSRSLDRDCYLNFDRVFTVSDEVKKHFIKYYPQYQNKVAVFHNMLDYKKITSRAKEAGGFTDSYDGIRLLTVGRLAYQKAYDIAIDAMKIIKDSGCKARWYVLGEGSEREMLEKKIAQFGLQKDFLLLGAVENPYPYYVQTDIYVHATRFEGKSIAIQEAQILGCPVIASDCNGNREQIENGIDGILCSLTPEAIADSIKELIADPKKREKYAKRAQNRNTQNNDELDLLLKMTK